MLSIYVDILNTIYALYIFLINRLKTNLSIDDTSVVGRQQVLYV